MRPSISFLVFGLALTVSSRAQTSCNADALQRAAQTAAFLRHGMHTEAVNALDARVPPAIATELLQLKAALADAAQATFACASPEATPEEIQTALADALHANLNQASETVVVTRDRKDEGAYGSDLAVQVFPLFNSPRYYEVDFRYGVECGDDNLLMVFKAGAGTKLGPWSEVLRWGAPAYNTVSDAFGDFILLTPLSGFQGHRNWRFVVAHGQPACSGASAPSHFDLDLLEPSNDPSQPTVVWHLQQAYLRSQEPRLSTTEDTVSFELSPPGHAAKRRTRPTTTASASFRYHVTQDNKVEPLTEAPEAEAPSLQPHPATQPASQSASTRSPQ